MSDIKEQLRQFFTEAVDALTSRPFGGPTRPVRVPEFLKSCDTTKVPYLIDKDKPYQHNPTLKEVKQKRKATKARKAAKQARRRNR